MALGVEWARYQDNNLAQSRSPTEEQNANRNWHLVNRMRVALSYKV